MKLLKIRQSIVACLKTHARVLSKILTAAGKLIHSTAMKKEGTLPNANSKRSSMEKKPPAVRDLLSEFCGYTTAHGLGRLSQSKNAFTRLVWSLFCIAAFTVFVIEVYSLLDLYLSKPVSTIVKVEHENVSNLFVCSWVSSMIRMLTCTKSYAYWQK